MLGGEALGRGVLDLVASDLQLLEASVNDLVVALGGAPKPGAGRGFERLKSARLIESFSRAARNERTYGCYRQFRGLEVPVDSFVRILKLHLDRGFAFMARAGASASSLKLLCLCYVDAVFDLYYGVLKQVVTFTLHDCVYLYKFFVKLEGSLAACRLRHVYVRDEIYDLVLHSLWFALKDAWWLYLDPRPLRPLLPFIAHMRVEGQYDVTVHDLSHVLHNVNFVTLISQDMAFQSETATLVDSGSAPESDPFARRAAGRRPSYEDVSEGDLEIKYVREVSTFGLAGEGEGPSEPDPKAAFAPDGKAGALCDSDLEGALGLASHLGAYEHAEEGEAEPSWSQVMYVALVGCTYVVLFESYLAAVSAGLRSGSRARSYVELLGLRLQDLVQVADVLLEVDCNYTAWAHDKLGASSDAHLLSCFNSYSDRMFAGGRGREGSPPCQPADGAGALGGSGRGAGMYLLSPTLARLQRLQHEILLELASAAAAPLLRAIGDMYLIRDSRLYYDLLYSTDEYLLGPGGPLSRSCRQLPLRFKRALFVHTFFPVVRSYALKVAESADEPCEAVFFDSLSIWDSVVDFFDFGANPLLVEEECVRLVGGLLDQVKFTTRVDVGELDAFAERFSLEFASCQATPQPPLAPLAVYAYECLAHAGRCASRGGGDALGGYGFSPDFPASAQPGCSALDRYAVWLDGVRKKRMLIFGNLILFFRDNSLLQPVGFIAFSSIYSVLAPHTLAQVHPNVQILENNSENDSFSCGTSESSRSSNSPDQAKRTDTQPVSEAQFGAEGGELAGDSREDSAGNALDGGPEEGPRSSPKFGRAEPGGVSGLAYQATLRGVCGLERTGRVGLEGVASAAYLDPRGDCLAPLRRGNVTGKTRLSTLSSRRSSVVDNVLVWGWQIRLDLFDACVLDEFSCFDLFVDLEFTSPESRDFWGRQIRDRAAARSQVISWPYHSLFFDSI